jgi:hypothetical protein
MGSYDRSVTIPIFRGLINVLKVKEQISIGTGNHTNQYLNNC